MTKLQRVKDEILSMWGLKESTKRWVLDFHTIREIEICLNDLTGHIVWDVYGHHNDTKENREKVKNELLRIINKY